MEGKRGSECLLKSVSNIDFNPILQKDISGEENQGIVELNENDREKIAKEWLVEIFKFVKS
ncbi:hypothetical protein HEQ45_11050 [Lactobacillus sp. ZJLC29-4]|uniref:Uncharacterized protein n=1 Tax=Levilactobacillus tujiorum TaxID=2912243 RepID=A0ABX1L6N5_9LACO|nr:hypothetical protein [Levilactobacillus tujiorum]MCH5465678.1 hypothetical protein [Levilactobacillus tujiorum]NLR12962.1 hypothetical protein [Lactobacillus sp. HBUAS51387]NLR30751.1 hypothetical protein [Levilactobacillus tujiorum]